MATTHERLMQWLRDADAMEKHAEAMLGALAQRIENYEEVKAQIERHLREAQEQAIALEEYVERRRCEDTSAWKDSPEQRAAFGHGFSCAFGGNEFIRRAITEISCYNVLIGAAAAAGGSETRAICEDILHREEAMLDWLKRYLASAIEQYLDHEEATGMTKEN